MSALTTQVQGLGCRIASLQGLRDWIRWPYWQDVLNPGVECGVAFLLERGHVGICWLPMASGCVCGRARCVPDVSVHERIPGVTSACRYMSITFTSTWEF